jgi:mannose/cellobiose epimerase-like protein (N-acyl-D-glucosamine 2-epimerase family)
MPSASSLKDKLLDIRNKAVANLKDSVLPFWTRATWDPQHGGFWGRVDRGGNVVDTSEKLLIKQVRMLWSLSAAHKFGITDKGYLELATGHSTISSERCGTTTKADSIFQLPGRAGP